jgi:hypothetical protein
MIEIAPGAPFETVVQGFPTGLTGTVGVQVIDNAGGIAVPRGTAGISEVTVLGVGSGIYVATLTAPLSLGQYTVVWDKGAGGVTNVAVRNLVVRLLAIAHAALDFISIADSVRHELLVGDMEMFQVGSGDRSPFEALVTDEQRTDVLAGDIPGG